MNVRGLISKGVKWYFKHDREILKGVSMAASVASMVFAWNARAKCEEVLIEKEAEGASNLEKAKAIAPVIAPMVIAQGISIGTSVAEYRSTGKKLAGLVNMVSSYKTISDIKNEIEKQHLTDDKIKAIENDVIKKRLETVPEEEIEKTGHGDTIFIEPEYMGKVWRSSKDFVELGIARNNNKLYQCYDKYGSCIRDDFAISLWDFCEEQRLQKANMWQMYEFCARDFRELPVYLEPIEYENKDGTTELGYKVVFTASPSLAPSGMLRGAR